MLYKNNAISSNLERCLIPTEFDRSAGKTVAYLSRISLLRIDESIFLWQLIYFIGSIGSKQKHMHFLENVKSRDGKTFNRCSITFRIFQTENQIFWVIQNLTWSYRQIHRPAHLGNPWVRQSFQFSSWELYFPFKVFNVNFNINKWPLMMVHQLGLSYGKIYCKMRRLNEPPTHFGCCSALARGMDIRLHSLKTIPVWVLPFHFQAL